MSCIEMADYKPNCSCDKCNKCPIAGKTNNAIEFNKKTIAKADFIDLLLAFITGEIAAMALPSHIVVSEVIK